MSGSANSGMSCPSCQISASAWSAMACDVVTSVVSSAWVNRLSIFGS